MTWGDLRLWAAEEKAIREWLVESLDMLIKSGKVEGEDGELAISGKLYPIMRTAKKKRRLAWTFHREVSTFREEDDPSPIGHPDFRLSTMTADHDQYDYDIEAKLLRDKKKGWDYCLHYVIDGIQRYRDYKYGQSMPAMGSMIGYIQQGDILTLCDKVNQACLADHFANVINNGGFRVGGTTTMSQTIVRSKDSFDLRHLWADLRKP